MRTHRQTTTPESSRISFTFNRVRTFQLYLCVCYGVCVSSEQKHARGYKRAGPHSHEFVREQEEPACPSNHFKFAGIVVSFFLLGLGTAFPFICFFPVNKRTDHSTGLPSTVKWLGEQSLASENQGLDKLKQIDKIRSMPRGTGGGLGITGTIWGTVASVQLKLKLEMK